MKLPSTLLLATLVLGPPLSHAQDAAQTAPQPTLATRLSEVLSRDQNGHSPTDEDLNSALTIKPSAGADEVSAALPLLKQALVSHDAPVRTYALNLLAGLENPDNQADPAAPAADAPAVPPAPLLKPPVAAALASALPQITACLTDDVPTNRVLASSILGGFAGNSPASVYAPLYAFLKRDDAIGPVGTTVVADLLVLAPLSPESEAAIARYIHRSDQTPDSQANLVDAIGTSPNQTQTLNKSMLSFLAADDPNLRARVILSLPALDLAPDVFADTRTRVAQLVDNSSENLQVVNAAKAVAPCWTSTKMTSGCPTY